jgi:predicted nucleic acid-binding protein
MPEAITNTSPVLYLHRIGVLEWLPQLCDDIWIPQAVVDELQVGRRNGYEVPIPETYPWLEVVEPRAVPSEWLSLDLGPGELAVLAIALDHLKILRGYPLRKLGEETKSVPKEPS